MQPEARAYAPVAAQAWQLVVVPPATGREHVPPPPRSWLPSLPLQHPTKGPNGTETDHGAEATPAVRSRLILACRYQRLARMRSFAGPGAARWSRPHGTTKMAVPAVAGMERAVLDCHRKAARHGTVLVRRQRTPAAAEAGSCHTPPERRPSPPLPGPSATALAVTGRREKILTNHQAMEGHEESFANTVFVPLEHQRTRAGRRARGRGIEAGAQSSGGDMSSVKPDLERELTELHTKCVTRPLRPRACDRVHAIARACPACAGRGARLVAAVLPVRMCMHARRGTMLT